MKTILALALALLMLPLPAQAAVHVNVTNGNPDPMPVAVSDFSAATPAMEKFAHDIPQVIINDLGNTGLFKPLNQNSFSQSPDSIAKDGVHFNEWRSLGPQALVTGVVKETSDGRVRVEFRLWDVFGQAQIAGTAYTTTKENWRRIGHMVADEIYKRITGEQGYFDTRIVYISESGPPNARIKRLAIMDQDGYNQHYLTDGSYLVLTPRFSPNTQVVAYMSYYHNKPRVYLYDINSGRQEVLGDFPGMTFSPRFSPDGNKVVMSMIHNGNSDIYVMNLRTRKALRLTAGASLNTSPSYSPDGKKIVFESDRGGTQQLYVMGADGSNPTRITFGDGRYANPVWSPRGDLIAFIKMLGSKFYLGVIRPDGSGERLITSGYDVESPSWSPNGRVLVYFKEEPTGDGTGRRSRLYTIDLTGFNEHMLPTPQDASDPAWSPLNP